MVATSNQVAITNSVLAQDKKIIVINYSGRLLQSDYLA